MLVYHLYDRSFSKTQYGKGGRTDAMRTTKAMRKQFKKYLVGVKYD